MGEVTIKWVIQVYVWSMKIIKFVKNINCLSILTYIIFLKNNLYLNNHLATV